MGDAYRLSELGFRLPAGMAVLPPETFEAVVAATAIVAAAESRAAENAAAAERAFEDRRREGYETGLAEGRRESLRRLLAENAQLDAALRACEADLARLVGAGIRKLVSDFDDDTRAAIVVREALRRMRREKRAELRVAPEQVAALRDRIGGIVAEFPEMELVDVVPDAALSPPQVVLESRVGRIEADFGSVVDDIDAMIRAAGSRFAEAGA